MQFKTWREFFGKDSWLYSARMIADQKSVPNDISAEELYQHFKARLMDEVVATHSVPFGISPSGTTFITDQCPLKNKEV
jgi:hypothetical protein